MQLEDSGTHDHLRKCSQVSDAVGNGAGQLVVVQVQVPASTTSLIKTPQHRTSESAAFTIESPPGSGN
jgi:hypothetical protein